MVVHQGNDPDDLDVGRSVNDAYMAADGRNAAGGRNVKVMKHGVVVRQVSVHSGDGGTSKTFPSAERTWKPKFNLSGIRAMTVVGHLVDVTVDACETIAVDG